MCTEHKHLWGKEWDSLSCWNTAIVAPVTQVENKVVAEIPEWASKDQVTSFTDKVKDVFASVFK